jgi:hypothetical protein
VSPSSTSEPISYAADIKPLFRERDRSSMLSHFDLWSYDDVSDHAAAILARLEQGSMPCDGAWPADRVELFRSWLTREPLPSRDPNDAGHCRGAGSPADGLMASSER